VDRRAPGALQCCDLALAMHKSAVAMHKSAVALMQSHLTRE
jgi:hypothetical protein